MDEASSRFVDQIALDKLLNEKLLRCRHSPSTALSNLLDNPFRRLNWASSVPSERPGAAPGLRLLQSGVADEWYVVSEHEVPAPKGAVLLVHGLYEDNRSIYGFLIGELNRLSYSVYLTTLPYHYERIPRGSEFSGELFFSADLGRTKEAFCRACVELHECHNWLSDRSSVPVFVVGFSMGGTVALATAALSGGFRGLTIINPAARLLDVIWTSPLCQSIKRDLVEAGHSESDVRRVIASFDPYALDTSAVDQERIQLIYALYDQITLERQYEALAAQWRLPNVLRYKAGHLNTLRVPRLAEDIAVFNERFSQKPDEIVI